MYHELKEFDIAKLPLYRKQGDLVIVGVNHRAAVTPGGQDKKRVRYFMGEVSSWTMLLLEANKYTNDSVLSFGLNTYEAIAARQHPGRTHYLEEGENQVAFGEKYGIRRDLFLLYYLTNEIAENLCTSPRLNLDYLSNAATRLGLCIPGLPSLAMDYTIHSQVPRFVTRFQPNEMMVFAAAFQLYLGQVREREVLAPKIKRLHDMNPGKKGAVVGTDHVDAIAEYISKGSLPSLPPWRVFLKEGKTDICRKANDFVKDLEDHLFPA
jgi:hypothetical protein